MTRSVWRKRAKVIGLVLSVMMLGLWVFSVMIMSSYATPSSQWLLRIEFGRISFHVQSVNNPGWICLPLHPQLKDMAARLPWTSFAHSYLGFGLPAKDQVLPVLYSPVWLLLVAAGFPTAILWWRDRRPKAGFCEVCKYDLTGNESGTCPECGSAVDASQHADKPPRGGV